MFRTAIAVFVLCVAVIYVPLWVQLVLFVFAIAFFRFRGVFLIPALLSDAWYAPSRNLLPGNNKMFLVVLGMIVIYFVIVRLTRIRERYGLETL